MASYDFMVDTYETEGIKIASVWSQFADEEMEFRPAPLSRTPHEQMVHQCVSENTWMTNMLGIDAGMPPLPTSETRLEFLRHYAAATATRLAALREKAQPWWEETTTFF